MHRSLAVPSIYLPLGRRQILDTEICPHEKSLPQSRYYLLYLDDRGDWGRLVTGQSRYCALTSIEPSSCALLTRPLRTGL
ncbi:hypothetical protein RRG08_001867 [Elysia crispata]|uniref:Uncharacterized protein n=1 Tax=Elysia crispata TaxID=231223 RepID=A0AAE1A5C6_9GAST|nr:hypothetical protein RRG08_001867 [Elysia crispata]